MESKKKKHEKKLESFCEAFAKKTVVGVKTIDFPKAETEKQQVAVPDQISCLQADILSTVYLASDLYRACFIYTFVIVLPCPR
jgi:hypothetical protein